MLLSSVSKSLELLGVLIGSITNKNKRYWIQKKKTLLKTYSKGRSQTGRKYLQNTHLTDLISTYKEITLTNKKEPN